jgi:CspA family cold shock protein
MSSSAVSTPAVSSSSERFTGRVKWFNNKAGYGFISVTDGPKSGTDVFVHHSSIKVDSEQYKYLVQGEYVDFSLSDTKTQDHEFQAGEVCGIKGGKLMCETRRDSRVARSQYRASRPEQTESSEPVKMPRSVAAPREQKSQRPPRARGQGPREEAGEWTYVPKARKVAESASAQSTSQPQRASGGRGRGRPSKSTGRGEGKTQSS